MQWLHVYIESLPVFLVMVTLPKTEERARKRSTFIPGENDIVTFGTMMRVMVQNFIGEHYIVGPFLSQLCQLFGTWHWSGTSLSHIGNHIHQSGCLPPLSWQGLNCQHCCPFSWSCSGPLPTWLCNFFWPWLIFHYLAPFSIQYTYGGDCWKSGRVCAV